jgi:PKD-like domain
MKLAIKAYLTTLILLAFVFAVSAQTTNDDDRRSEKDPRNTAPTVGTGGSPGGPTGLFTVYDGQTLRRGEYTFSVAYSNFDRDPGNADIVEVPVSFQIGLTNHVELFFNTDAYRAIKVNSPRNLSSFYLPNSQLLIDGRLQSGGAVVLAPQGPGTRFVNGAVFRPQGSQPFVQFPYVGGSAGTFGFPNQTGVVFGFPAGTNPTLGAPAGGGNGAANFPGIGSVYGSILPGVVLQTTTLANSTATSPTVYTTAPTYLPDAPFINRTYGESSFNTFTVGAKIRFTSLDNPIGVGVIPFYRFYADKATDFSGFNQLQRGASPGGNRGDFGGILFADARLRKWINVSGNIGYIYNSSVKADFPGGEATILDRGDEILAAVGVDFPVNRYFQPILEFRSQQFVGGRTPNAFENNPLDGLAGVRIFPARWMGFSFAYRYHANQQDRDSFDDEQATNSSVLVTCPAGTQGCVPQTITTSFRGVPPGFQTSTDPHGFIVQAFIGRRDDRANEVINPPANVTAVALSQDTVTLPCPERTRAKEGANCSDNQTINVTTTAVDPDNDPLTYQYTVSGGRIVGQGANVSWDTSGLRPGTYTITTAVDDGCGFCGQTQTKTITVKECDCEPVPDCNCPTVTVTGPSGLTNPGETMTFTANGGNPETTYNWSVSAGTIESGQGTPSITVSTTPDMAGSNVTATVTLGGAPEGCNCPTTASETAGLPAKLEAVPVDEFGDLRPDDVKARLDALFAELGNNPNDQGYIINYGTARQIAAREKIITTHIRFRRFDASRITIVRGGDTGAGINTKLFRVPAGAENPAP